MNVITWVNYFIEANIALLVLLVLHKLLLTKESNFRFIRIFMLAGIMLSLALPLINLKNVQAPVSIPSISQVIPSYWLPEVLVTPEGSPAAQQKNTIDTWTYFTLIYGAGVLIFLIIFVIQLIRLIHLIRHANFYRKENLCIIESTEYQSTFSFFHFIFLGNAHTLSDTEKQQVIHHESTHARQWHSFDILVIQILRILFWFNPFIILYKKIFVQLHEFEADARAVENQDTNMYCNLLARVALQSAGYSIANHFNNSLTVKRIEMIRTLKTNIKKWKLAALAVTFFLVFFVIACQDQVMDQIEKSTITQIDSYPAFVQADIEKRKIKRPNATFTYVEGTEDEVRKLLSTGHAEKMILNTYPSTTIGKPGSIGVLLMDLTQHADQLKTKDHVYTVVEEGASFVGDMPAMMEFLQKNILYPKDAADKKLQGKVFVKFIVNEDGKISDPAIVRGVDPLLDQEALRVVNLMPNWNPGKQGGIAVKQRMVLPIAFSLDGKSIDATQSQPMPVEGDIKVNWTREKVDGMTVLTGSVTDMDNKPIRGMNIILKGMPLGTVSDSKGNFRIKVPKENGELVFSFVGYKTTEVIY